MIRILILAVGLNMAAATLAEAQTAAQRAACGADAKKFCPGMRPGGGSLLNCLTKNKKSISAACRKILAQQGR